jgi:glycosyltransferase involved in cell wall biosynthesis
VEEEQPAKADVSSGSGEVAEMAVAANEQGAMASIVIPAHNEEQVIGRCLTSILHGAQPGEFDVVVVTNGCTDRTAEIAGSFPGVRVVDSPVASKPAALNLGDRTAKVFPRLYVDADVEVDPGALRAVSRVLTDGGYDLAAPQLRFDFENRPWSVRAFYDVWSRLPYARDDLVGAGFYGMSERARSKFGDFPDTMSEDFFVHSLVAQNGRRAVPGHYFVLHPPLTLRSLVKIQTRMQAANRRNRELFEDAANQVRATHLRQLAHLAKDVRLLPRLALYGFVVGTAKVRGRWKNRSATVEVWDRDTTARQSAATDTSS